jgi:tetratricopeptide (TPR) repeat protein
VRRIEELGWREKEDGWRGWKMMVEGVGDLTKRKAEEGCGKLKKAVLIAEDHCSGSSPVPSSIAANSNKSSISNVNNSSCRITAIPSSNIQECQSLLRCVYPYLAYALFITSNLAESLRYLQKALALAPSDNRLLYCLDVTKGMLMQQEGKYEEAAELLERSFGWESRGEALFMAAVVLVKGYKAKEKEKALKMVNDKKGSGNKAANPQKSNNGSSNRNYRCQ